MSETWENLSELELVVRSQAGERRAFELLVRRVGRLVYCRHYLDTRDPHQAEDLTQETFLVAWKSISQVTEPAGFRTWLLSIARSTLRDAARRQSRQKRGGGANFHRKTSARALDDDPLQHVPDAGPTPSEALDTQEDREQVLGLLRELPDEYRLPIMLRYIGGADYQTIGQQLGVSNGSLRGLLNRGMAKLRKAMQKTGFAEEVASAKAGP